MKMKQLLILVGVVVVLWVIFVLMDRSAVPTAEENYLVKVDTTRINELEIMHGGQTVTLTRRDDGSWFITNPVNFRANRRYVSQLLEKLGEMRIESEVTGNQDRWGEFEVDTTGVDLTIRANGEEHRVVIGKAAESYRQSYARMADNKSVYLINGTYKMLLTRSVDNWRDKEIFHYTQEDIVGIETADWVLSLSNNEWKLTANGADVPVDKSAAGNLNSQITKLRTSSFPEAAEYASVNFTDKPAAEVQIDLKSGDKVTLQFFLDPGNERRYFVKYKDEDTIYAVFEGIYNQIFKKVDDLKAKEPPAAAEATPGAEVPPPATGGQ